MTKQAIVLSAEWIFEVQASSEQWTCPILSYLRNGFGAATTFSAEEKTYKNLFKEILDSFGIYTCPFS
jgi:hypothetical protein